jgi:4-amino-4-deoxy-L-arabinose transferase-like glycosyltransferase
LPRADTLDPPRAGRRGSLALALILLFALAVRVWLAQGSTQDNMDPDAAHFLNIARSFQSGQGFSNPADWPAWIQPARLPMPETLKEPAYPWLIAQLGASFRAGQLLSLLAGVLLPWAAYALGRRRALDHSTALLAALLVAASPLAVLQSVRVMVDEMFALVVTAMFLLASRHLARPDASRPLGRDLAAGALFGVAFLLRAQTLMLILPLLVLLFEGRTVRAALAPVALAFTLAVAVASPLWLRNLALFHRPLYSDVVAFGLWPYIDKVKYSHGLERPPAVLPFVLGHIPLVLGHMARGFVTFFVHALPEEIVGHAFWMLPLAAGVLLSLKQARTWLFAWLYLGITLVFIMAVHWDARYFTSSIPLYCLLTALGAITLARAMDGITLGPVRAPWLLGAATAVIVVLEVMSARRIQREFAPPELAAAIHEAPFLRERLAPGEAVLAVTTSYWSWFSQRPSVHLVIADEPRFDAVMRRLKVRWAALPTSRLPEFAARYPEHMLPRSLVFDHADSTRDVTVFAVRAEATP